MSGRPEMIAPRTRRVSPAAEGPIGGARAARRMPGGALCAGGPA